MTEQKLKQAQQAVMVCEQVTNSTFCLLNLQDRINTQNAIQFLKELLTEEAKNVSPPPA